MDTDRFNVVFTGKLIEGFQIEVVKENFANAFKVGGMQLDALFQGKAVILKKNVSLDSGKQYQAQLNKFGMLTLLTSIKPPKVSIAENAVPATPNDPSPFTEKVAESADAFASSTSDDHWSIAPAGSDMNQLDNSLPPVVVDVSGISIAPLGSDLLVEKKNFVAVDVDTSKLSLQDN